MAEQTKSGLLQRAQSLLAQATPTFDEWAARQGFKHAGILELRTPSSATENGEGYYHLAESTGFSAKTIVASLSPRKFWDEMLSKASEWQCFSKDFNELVPFFDLFEDGIRDSIDSLYFLPFLEKENPRYLVIAEFSDEDDIVLPPSTKCATTLSNIENFRANEKIQFSEMEKNVEKGLKISNAHLLILSLKSCVEKIIQNSEVWRKLSKIETVDRIEMKSHILCAIANATFSVLSPMFRSPNCSHIGKNGEIKIVLFGKDENDEEVISYHLATALCSLLGSDAAQHILLLSAGICPSKKGVLAFLQKG